MVARKVSHDADFLDAIGIQRVVALGQSEILVG